VVATMNMKVAGVKKEIMMMMTVIAMTMIAMKMRTTTKRL
jgi:hypothetical protein